MLVVRLHRRLVALLALLAVAFGALAPLMAHAVVSGAGPELAMEVCTSTGMLLVQADPGPEPGGDGPQASPMQKPCLWCGMHAVAAPPPVAAAAHPLLRCAQAMPVAFYRAGPTSTVWLHALSRAPPAARG